MSDAEMNVAAAAEYMQVSEDTVRALIRDKILPATQTRRRGAYVLKEADVQTVTEKRAAGDLAGPSAADPVEVAKLVARELRARAYRVQEKAELLRRNAQARHIRATTGTGYGAVTDMADALGLHRTVVQRWLKGADSPAVSAALDAELADVEAREAAAVAAADAADREVERLQADTD